MVRHPRRRQRNSAWLWVLMLVFLLASPRVLMACDVCGCYFGLMPFERYHRTDIMWRYSRFNGYRNIPLPNAGPQPHQLFKTQHDPIFHQGPNSAPPAYSDRDNEVFHTLEVRSSWFVTSRLNIAAVLPYKSTISTIEDNRRHYQGLGDVQVVPVWFPIWKDKPDWGIRLGLQAGIKLPTGHYRTDDPQGQSLLQNGTGAWDFTPGAHIWLRWRKWGMASVITHRRSTTNSQAVQLQATTNAQALCFRRLQMGREVQLMPTAGLYYENFDGVEYQGYWLRGTGGQLLSTVVGADAYWKTWVLSMQWQNPVAQDLLGTQLGNAGRLQVGLGFLIPAKPKAPVVPSTPATTS